MKIKMLSVVFGVVLSLAIFCGCASTPKLTNEQAATAITAVTTELEAHSGSMPASLAVDLSTSLYKQVNTGTSYAEVTQLVNSMKILTELLIQNKIEISQTFSQYDLSVQPGDPLKMRMRAFADKDGVILIDALLADDYANPSYYQIIRAQIDYNFDTNKVTSFLLDFMHNVFGSDEFISNKFVNNAGYVFDETAQGADTFAAGETTKAKALLNENFVDKAFDITAIHNDIVSGD